MIVVPIKAKFIEKDGELILLRSADAETLLRVKRGEFPVQERIVNFGYGNVFDISQTTCLPEKYPSYYATGFADEQYDYFADFLEQYAKDQLEISECPIPVKKKHSII